MLYRSILAALCFTLSACGGGAPAVIPEAQAAEPVNGCPTGDATAQLQAMVDAAPGVLELPACVFRTSAPLVVSKPLHLFGQGARATFIVSSAAEALVVAPNVCVGQGNRSHIHGFAIDPATPGGQGSAMVIRPAAGSCFNNFEIEHLYLGDFGGPGLWIDNPSASPSVFTGTIRRNRITNGLLATNIADSVQIVGNTMPDGLTSRAVKAGKQWGIDISTVRGAAKLVVSDNNITAPGGCIRIRNTVNASIVGNWCEYPEYYGYSNTGDLATVHLIDVHRSKIADNLVAPGTARYAMVIDGSSEFNALDSNELGLGRDGHLAFMGASHGNKLTGLPYYRSVPDPTNGKISGAGTGLLSSN